MFFYIAKDKFHTPYTSLGIHVVYIGCPQKGKLVACTGQKN